MNTNTFRTYNRALVGLLGLLLTGLAQASDIVEVLPLTDKIVLVHFDDGYVIHHQKGQKRSDETLMLDSLLTGSTMQLSRYEISSPGDPNYAAARNPVDIGRKSKGTDYAWFCDAWNGNCVNTRPDHAKEHWIYLFLPTAMQSGQTYTLNTGDLAKNGSAWTFTFDVTRLRSEAVHVNNIGYAPAAALKYGYVYQWLGDKGGLNLAPYAGRPFHLINVATNAVAFSGTLVFRKGAAEAETAWTNQTPNGNFGAADVYECNFSAFTMPGEYRLSVDGIGCSFPFRLADDAHFEPFYWVMKGIFQQRSGISLDAPFTDHPRPAPHNPARTPGFAGRLKYTTTRYFDVSNADADPADKATWEAGIKGDINTYGWYQDAGDWDGYFSHTTVPSLLLFLYEINPARFTDGQLQIPESGNGLPDLLDEAAWLLRFYKRTKDEIVRNGWGTGGVGGARVMGDLWGEDTRADGTTKGSWEDTDRQWIVSGEDPWTTYRYAALAAQYAYNLQKLGTADPEGVNWQQEAINAYAWARANTKPGDGVKFNVDIVLQRLYAAVSLYRLTGTAAYHDQFKADFAATGWNGNKSNLDGDELYPIWLYLTLPANRPTDAATLANARAASNATADLYLANFTDRRAARWGGNFWQPMNTGQPTTPKIIQGVYGYLDNRTSHPAQAATYLNYTYTTADYFLGANPLNTTWITGLGERSPVGIFHLDSWYSGLPTPRRGLVPYGPWQRDVYLGPLGPWNSNWPDHTLYPTNPDSWPGHERWFDQRSAPLSCEFTVWQTNAPAAFIYGFLYAKSTLPDPSNQPTATTLTKARIYPRWGNRMTGGKFQGSLDKATWTDLAVITAPPANNVWTDYPITTSVDYRYLRYLSPDDGWGNVAELEFYNGTMKRTGVGFGTAGSYNNLGDTFEKALDGNINTFFDGPTGNGNYVGIDTQGTPSAGGQVTYEYWSNVGGLTLDVVDWSSPPTGTQSLTALEGPVNWADNYGARIRGYIIPSVSGTYTLYVASDDYGDLALSTDADPTHKTVIASVNGWTFPREWTKYPAQQSVPVALAAGQKYYVEARMKEANGGDHLAVGWTGPGITTISVIGGANIAPYTPGSGRLAADGPDASVTVFPNPARHQLTVRFRATTDQPVRLMLTTLSGQTVLSQSVSSAAGDNRASLTLPDLPAGLYLLHIEQPTGKIIRKVLIER